jgi:hypothetical protein
MAGAGTFIASSDQVRVQPHLGKESQCCARCRMELCRRLRLAAVVGMTSLEGHVRAMPKARHRGLTPGAGEQASKEQRPAVATRASLSIGAAHHKLHAGWRRVAVYVVCCGTPARSVISIISPPTVSIPAGGERARATMRRSRRPWNSNACALVVPPF